MPKKNNKRKKTKALNFFKWLIVVVEAHGLFCVTMSYILAWMDKVNVVETVSSTIVTEIVAPIITYGITRVIENIFEKNKLSFSTPLKNLNDDEVQG